MLGLILGLFQPERLSTRSAPAWAEPGVIPTQAAIEKKFALRRKRGGNPLDRLIRTLLGLDAKTRQYTQGSSFVRQVVDQVGLDDFNAVWTSPETLPTKEEITTPADWVKRVHG